MKNVPLAIDVVEAKTSKIDSVDFDNLVFGNVFADHMMECDYVDGQWQNPVIKPYGPIQLDPSAKVFHYGQAIFEGMKAFKDDEDQVWLFRPWQTLIGLINLQKDLQYPNFLKIFLWKAWKRSSTLIVTG